MDSSFFKKTKILATLGPATDTEEIISSLVKHGMNGARFNFSHGTHEDHKRRFAIVRDVEKKLGQPIAIVADLQGPKIRLGVLRGESLQLKSHDRVILFYGSEQVDERLPIQIDIFPYLRVGAHILVNDGLIRLRVEQLADDGAHCVVVAGGEVRSHKGVALPDSSLPNASLTEKDKEDLLFALGLGIDYVAVSFVQTAEDLIAVKKIIAQHESKAKIIVKVERALAIKHLDSILEESDMVMIARGDMAVEIGQEEVPIVQRKIITLCRKFNIPVIVATQMLESMVHNAEPTRAEVNDVASAVMEQVDAVMLSAETAHGDYPVEAISMMSRIIRRVETYDQEIKEERGEFMSHSGNQTEAVTASATFLAHQLDAAMIFAFTSSGRTALSLSHSRPYPPIVVVTDNPLVYKQLCMVWGVVIYLLEKITSNQEAFSYVVHMMQEHELISAGDRLVLVAGIHPGVSGDTNSITVTTA